MSQFASPEQPPVPGAVQTDPEPAPAVQASSALPDVPTPADGLFDSPAPSDDADAAFTVPPVQPRTMVYPRPRARTVAGIAGMALMLGVGGGVAGAAAWHEWGPDDAPSAQVATLPVSAHTGSPAPADGSIPAVAQTALPSVVQIQTTTQVGGSTGSGVIIRSDGYILTNNHVVTGATGVERVLFSDGEVRDATVVGTSVDYDLAVIKVDATGLTPLVLGDSDALVVGDQVVAVGSPLGLDATVTSGIVSALNRPVTTGEAGGTPSYMAAIQTDAAINPGNSGGPLLNMNAEVIGINSAVAAMPGATQATGAGSVGLGFAIPSNQARRVADELIADGHAKVPAIGAQLDRTYKGRGVRVADHSQFADGGVGVVPGSPADVAGVREGDIIVAIGSVPVADSNTAVVMIRSHAPGDTMTFTVRRDGEDTDLTVTLGVLSDLNYDDGGVGDASGGGASQ